jgi:general stress protein 26
MNDAEEKAKIWQHVGDIGVCMMVSRDGDWVRARPMRGIATPESGEIWFVTSRDTSMAGEIDEDPRCCLTYCDQRSQAYVSLSGQMSVVVDRKTMRSLWNEGKAAYFPAGPDDPNAVLLRFEPEIAQYWEAPSGPILLAIRFLHAELDGERPRLGATGMVRY